MNHSPRPTTPLLPLVIRIIRSVIFAISLGYLCLRFGIIKHIAWQHVVILTGLCLVRICTDRRTPEE